MINKTPEEYVKRYRRAIETVCSLPFINSYEEYGLLLDIAMNINGLVLSDDAVSKDDKRYPSDGPINVSLRSGRYLDALWIDLPEGYQKIVCSAVRGIDGFVISGIRHYSNDMRSQIVMCRNPDNFRNRPHEDQGFLDQRGTFFDRREAFAIALAAGQLDNMRPGCEHHFANKELYSEMLY